MATIRDAQDAFLAGKAMFEAWKAEFEFEWYKPELANMILSGLAKLSDEQIAQLREANPVLFDAVIAKIKS